jgi:acyl-CoA thioesterase
MTHTDTAGPLDEIAGGPAARAAGIEAVEISPGACVLRMSVADFMLNAYGCCHGGFVFLVADTALGVAANAGRSTTLAAQAEIVYTAPVPAGAVLEAHAVERLRYGHEGRSGIYDVEVRTADGVVAQFRGTVRTLR